MIPAGERLLTRRDDVPPELLATLIPLVRECASTGKAELPTPSGLIEIHSICAQNAQRQMACWSLHRPNSSPLVTQALALRKQEGDTLWRALHSSENMLGPVFATEGGEAPTEPWMGIILHRALFQESVGLSGPLQWLGDYERYLAWAWIDGVLSAHGR
jgi:hypothetical protein